MKNYIEYLERQIEVCLEDNDLKREHWAFCQALRKYRELALDTSSVVESVLTCPKCEDYYGHDINHKCFNCGTKMCSQ